MKLYEILLLISFLFMCVFGKPARKPRRLKLYTEKPVTMEATTESVIMNTTSVMLNTTSVNESKTECLDCAEAIKLKDVKFVTEIPVIPIGDAFCSFCQHYLDPVEKEICIAKNCALK